MGLLKHLLFWPVTGPSFLTRFALGKVGDTVREELTSDQAVREDLLALQMRLELGDIDDEQYLAEESLLMQRLRDVRHWREQFGMGTSGGPVRVAGSAAPEGAAGPEDAGEGAERPGGSVSPEGARVDLDGGPE
jgi:hypothetical protein